MSDEVIGFIGTGSMGRPIASRLLEHGCRLLVHDVDRAAIRGLGEAAQSAREVAARATVVFLCLPTLEALRDVTLGPEGLSSGDALATCVNLSTAGPAFVREIASTLPERITFLDCPITGGAAAARAGTLSVTVSGAEREFQRVKPLLASIAAHVFYVGAQPGQAQIMKLLNNLLSFAAFVASCEAFAMGVTAGLDPDAMVEVINTGTGRNSATTHKFPENILPRTFDYGAKLAISYKDISLCLEEAERLGVPMWLAPMVKQVIGYAISQDGDAVDVTTLIKHYERWCGIEVRGKAALRRSPSA
jgi:3-hydroxyisobutyrate dehydrogenase-like beta-hydroxyacid dehydrogenase